MTLGRDSLSSRIAHELLAIGAVSLSPDDPYTWASGLKSPVYCDNRLIMGYPGIRLLVTSAFADIMGEKQIACDVIAGTATAGIPHAAWLAHHLDLPMVYVRGAVKSHGKGKQVEGVLFPGQRVVVVEDLISTGMSSTAVVAPLEAAGAVVSAILAIFTYGLKRADEAFKSIEIPLYTLTSFQDLIEAAAQSERVSESGLASLESWHADPEAWSDQFTDFTG